MYRNWHDYCINLKMVQLERDFFIVKTAPWGRFSQSLHSLKAATYTSLWSSRDNTLPLLMCPCLLSVSEGADLWLGFPALVCLESRASFPACAQQRKSIRNPLSETLWCQSGALCNIWVPVLHSKHLTTPIGQRMLLCCCTGCRTVGLIILWSCPSSLFCLLQWLRCAG